ncbi:MAG: hypothetical protein RLZ12_117 [Bacillota bacterium]
MNKIKALCGVCPLIILTGCNQTSYTNEQRPLARCLSGHEVEKRFLDKLDKLTQKIKTSTTKTTEEKLTLIIADFKLYQQAVEAGVKSENDYNQYTKMLEPTIEDYRAKNLSHKSRSLLKEIDNCTKWNLDQELT